MSKFEMDQEKNTNCETFRAELSAALEGRPQPEQLGPLGWNEHLLGCGSCRALLEAEEALEMLLASLPDPHLPPELTQRLLLRLARERNEAGLDRLLEKATEPLAPIHLAQRILAGLDSDRKLTEGSSKDSAGSPGAEVASVEVSARLDALLDSIPAPRIPSGLERRVLRALESERVAHLGSAGTTKSRGGRVVTGGFPAGNDGSLFVSRRIFAAAALLLLALGVTFWIDPFDSPTGDADKTIVATNVGADSATTDGATIAAGHGAALSADEPDQEFFEDYEVLENWDLLVSEDLDLLLASVDGFDQLVLEFGYGGDDEALETDDGGGG